MSDTLVRILIVGGVMAIVGVVVGIRRARFSGDSRKLRRTGLDQGVYLFTSSTCLECGPARDALADKVGTEGFSELTWESDPAHFQRLGIDAVPALMIVDGKGSGVLSSGGAERMISRLDP